MKSKSNLVWGIIIIGVGILILVNMLGLYIDTEGILFNVLVGGVLILYGVIKFLQRRWKFLPFFAFYTGLGFILFTYLKHINFFQNQMEESSVWMFVAPAAILAAGTMLVVKSFSKKETVINNNKYYYNYSDKMSSDSKTTHFKEEKDNLNIQNLFTSNVTVVTSKQFQGGFVSNRFSETTIDLKQVALIQDTVLTIENLFGSMQIVVPQNMKVQVVVTDNFCSSINEYGKEEGVIGTNQLTLNVNVKIGEVKIIRAEI